MFQLHNRSLTCLRTLSYLLILVAALSPGSLLQATTKRPNIILCMTDDQGWGDTSYNGHPVLKTPHLDQMARQGIRFERFYSGAPVCSPTRGSCLTARHPNRYGITFANVGRLPAEEIVLAEVLEQEGYATGHFGKWHLGTLTTDTKDSNRGKPNNQADFSAPWQHGFETCFSTEAKVPTYWREGAYHKYGTRYWTGPKQSVDVGQIRGDDSRLIMDRAVPFIKNAVHQDFPFLAVIWFHAPHLPVISAPPYTDGYEEHKDYYGCLTAVDQQMGRLRKLLKELKIENNTMLWFCSDNGPEGKAEAPGQTRGLRGRKRSLYEGGIRVPGLLIWPDRIKSSRLVNMPCSTCDYFPTVMEALGMQLPESDTRPYDGISLLPMITGKMDSRPRPIGFQSKKQLALIDNRFKLYSNNLGKSFQLYDLLNDAGEQVDLAEQHPEIVAAMQQTIAEWQESCQLSLSGKDYR